MGDADGDGSEWRVRVEGAVGAAMGRAGQANCTPLTAGRFLTGGGWGEGAPRELGRHSLMYPLPGHPGVEGQVDPVDPAELVLEEC